MEKLTFEKLNERISQLEEEIRKLQTELAVLRSEKLVEELLKTDGPLVRENETVTRTDRGLTVKGSRLTLYSILDAMKDNNSLKNVRDIFELTDQEMLDVLDYIHLHKEEVEKEYQEVLVVAQKNKDYWQERNKEQLESTYQQSETVRAKLMEMKEKYKAEKENENPT